MTVYVDNARRPYGRMMMCHMMADSEGELHAFAAAIGCERDWFQGDHYDLPLFRRKRAVENGAREIDKREMVAMRRRFRVTGLPVATIAIGPERSLRIHAAATGEAGPLPLVEIRDGELPTLNLTTAQAEALSDALMAAVRKARGVRA